MSERRFMTHEEYLIAQTSLECNHLFNILHAMESESDLSERNILGEKAKVQYYRLQSMFDLLTRDKIIPVKPEKSGGKSPVTEIKRKVRNEFYERENRLVGKGLMSKRITEEDLIQAVPYQ